MLHFALWGVLASVVLPPQLGGAARSLPTTSALGPLPEPRVRRARPTGRQQQPQVRQPASTGAQGGNSAGRRLTPGFSGEYLVQSPNVFRGVRADGQIVERPAILSAVEQQELVQSAWFYLASSDARRKLAAAAAVDTADDDVDIDDESVSANLSHAEILREMRASAMEAQAANGMKGRTPVRGTSGTVGARDAAALCLLLNPESLTDTEFRLRESVGRAAYNKLFLHTQGLVYHEVNKQLGTNWQSATVMQKADFLQEGAQGLLRAIRLFDIARGVAFSTYATWHIRAYVLRAARDKSRLVRLPQNLQADMIQIRKARYRYAVDNQGHTPTAAQLATVLQWSPTRVDLALAGLANGDSVSLDDLGSHDASPFAEGTNDALINRCVSAHGCGRAEAALMEQQLLSTLREAQVERDPRRAKMTRLRYGLEDGREWTYPQLAARYNTTANGAKGIVRTEVAFLRRKKSQLLRHFVRSD